MAKTKRYFQIILCGNLGVSDLTGKRVKADSDSPMKEHHLFCNHSSGFDRFSILASNNNDFKVTLMESLLINRDHPLRIRTSICYPWKFLMIKEYSFVI